MAWAPAMNAPGAPYDGVRGVPELCYRCGEPVSPTSCGWWRLEWGDFWSTETVVECYACGCQLGGWRNSAAHSTKTGSMKHVFTFHCSR